MPSADPRLYSHLPPHYPRGRYYGWIAVTIPGNLTQSLIRSSWARGLEIMGLTVAAPWRPLCPDIRNYEREHDLAPLTVWYWPPVDAVALELAGFARAVPESAIRCTCNSP